MKRIIVIGGGASGLIAAITAAREGASVTILEAMEKPGKKILITGNGKCNLTNLDFSRKDLYRQEENEDISSVLNTFSQEDTISFFRELGMLTHVKNNGVYPITDQSASVTELLLSEAKKWKVKIKCTERVQKIMKRGKVWDVQTGTWNYEGDSVILACGGKSYPQTGSDGSGYELAGKLGLSIVSPLPALVPLIIEENTAARLSGIRSQAKVTLYVSAKDGSEKHYEERGEVQWTDYGVSGIVIFQLSRYAVKACQKKQKAVLKMDLFPELEREGLTAFLKGLEGNKPIGELLQGILPKKMIPVALQQSGIRQERKLETLKEEEMEQLIDWMKAMTLTVKGSKSFDMAQVCQGGVSLREINLHTMEAKRIPGLYVAGELLDVDGICGGYNLQWAWSSGYLAGKASARNT